MALPPLRLDGTLPPGEHAITVIDEVFVLFPASNARRAVLNSALTLLLEVASRLKIGTSVVIDGSYITSKPEPEDIDIALLSTGQNETVTLQRLHAEGIDLVLLDIFVSTTQADFDRWRQFFSADRTGQARGVVTYTL